MFRVKNQYPRLPRPSREQPPSTNNKTNIGSGDSHKNNIEALSGEIYSNARRTETFPVPSPIRRYRKCNICSSTYRLGAEKERWWRIQRSASSNGVHFRRYGHQTEPSYGYGSKMECILAFFVMVFLFVAFFLTTTWIVFYRDGLSFSSDINLRFNWHPFLMVAGFVLLAGFSMLIPSLCICLRTTYMKFFHLALHCAVIPCIVFGISVILDHHFLSQVPLPNFKSLHSWLGLASIGTYALQLIFGFLRLVGNSWSTIARFHKSLGIIQYTLVTVTCLTGISEPMLRSDGVKLLIEDKIFKNCLGIIFLLTGILLIMFMKLKKVDI